MHVRKQENGNTFLQSIRLLLSIYKSLYGLLQCFLPLTLIQLKINSLVFKKKLIFLLNGFFVVLIFGYQVVR